MRLTRVVPVAQELMQRTGVLLLSPIARFLWRTARQGHRSLPRRGPVILAYNHASFLDPVLISASVSRPIHYLGKEFLFAGRVRLFLSSHVFGHIPLGEAGSNLSALDRAIAALQRGYVVAIAPEGARSFDGGIQRGRVGVARLAYATGAPIYPVAIEGTYEAWPRTRRLPRLFSATSVTVASPIVVERDDVAFDDPRRCRILTDRVMGAIAAGLGKPYEPAAISVPKTLGNAVAGASPPEDQASAAP